MSKYTKDARLVWNALNGVFMIYKPPGIHVLDVRNTIIKNLCRDLNEMEGRPIMKYVSIEGPTDKERKVIVRDSYADNPLVIGPRYQEDFFKMSYANKLCQESSGMLVGGVNSGGSLVHKLKTAKLTRFYKLKGILGQARSNDFSTGKIVEKSMWKRIKRDHIDRVCAAMQGSHQKKMFELCGLDIQSQEAYELAVKGPVRPANPYIPMVYTIKCVNYAPPEFTLEIVCINESPEYLKAMVAEIGYRLKSTAYCNYIQCSQFGLFNVKDALLSKYWNLQNIINNISLCHKILKEHPYMLHQEHANLYQQPVEKIQQPQITFP